MVTDFDLSCSPPPINSVYSSPLLLQPLRDLLSDQVDGSLSVVTFEGQIRASVNECAYHCFMRVGSTIQSCAPLFVDVQVSFVCVQKSSK